MTDAVSAFIDELLRPARLARDVERGLLGDILGRLDWPTRRYPMLAAWTEQWSRPAEEPQNSVPLVHARHPAPISTTTIHHVDVHPVPLRRAADPRPAPPLVQAKRTATPTPPAAPKTSRSPMSSSPSTSSSPLAPSPVAPAPPSQREPTRPTRTRESSRPVSLPRVVSAFRPDLSVRPAEPAPAPTLPHGREPAHTPHAPIAAPSSAPTVTREPVASSVPPTSPGTPTANPTVTAHRPADLADSPLVHAAPPAPHESSTPQQSHSDPAPPRPQPTPTDLPRVAATVEPAARPDVPLVHIDPAASPSATPTSLPHASLAPQSSPAPHTSPSSTTTRPVTTPRVAETTTPRVDPLESPLPHPSSPDVPRPRPVVAPQSTPVTRARTSRPATIAARWIADDEAPPLHRPPAARPQRVELAHAVTPPAPAAPTVARRPVPEASPSPATSRSSSAPTTTTTPPSPSSPSPSSPSASLDVDAVVDTTLRRLGRELERARGRRRAFR